MRGRIYKSLLFMGIISVVVTFILSAILYYQGMQEQISAELGRTARVVSGAVSKDKEESSIEYLDWVFKDNERAIHIVWLDTDGSVIYDSDHKEEDYKASGEVKAAFATGSGHEVHKDSFDKPKSYYAVRADDGTVLRLSSGRMVNYKGYSSYLPEIFIFLLVFTVGCLAAAERETESILKPFHLLGDLVQRIMKGEKVDELPPDADALQQALSEKRGSEVQLYVPQRGDKAHLVEMAHTNAVERLARESGRYAREEKLLDELAQVLGLAKPPRAIESYDISNWGDGTSVCGMVTFRDGKPYKAGYRKFRMKTVAGTDDYASLAETVSRRAAEYEKYSGMAANGEPSSNYFGQKPDLLLMDGGRGQVSAAREALAGTALADVPLYGMVKDDHHRTRAIVDSEGREIAINMNRGTFTFITAIQDETHRFANAYRKQQMHQKSYASTLTEVPGVGPKTAKALMAQFKSVGAVKEATPDQLENTPGVGRQMAQTIYEYFHPQG